MQTYDPDGAPREISLGTIATRFLAIVGAGQVLQWLGLF